MEESKAAKAAKRRETKKRKAAQLGGK